MFVQVNTILNPIQAKRHAGIEAASMTIPDTSRANLTFKQIGLSPHHASLQLPVSWLHRYRNSRRHAKVQTPIIFLYPKFESTALSCVLSYFTYLPLPLSISWYLSQ